MRGRLEYVSGLAVAAAFVLAAGGCGHTGAERVVLFPAAAHYEADKDEWVARIDGWVYQPRGWSMVRDLGFWFLADEVDEADADAARELYERRVDYFIVDGRSGRRVVIDFAGRQSTAGPSDSSGRFTHEMRFSHAEAERFATAGQVPISGRLADSILAEVVEATKETAEVVAEAAEEVADETVEAVTGEPPVKKPKAEKIEPADAADPPEPRYPGTIALVEPTGWSVISDVDDTIRLSHVSDKQKMVRHMFLYEYEPVPGMAERYRAWEASGAVFHYVSASPSQLLAEFVRFSAEAGFPRGTFGMKRIGFFDKFMSNIWASSTEVKPPIIRDLLDRYPGRTFILVGDSTEHDAAIYAEAYREHPEQVHRIYIRNVTGEPRDDPRWAKAFEGVPAERWVLFTDPGELEAIPKPEPLESVDAE